MPAIFFGYEPRAKGATKLAVTTVSGVLEPAEPSNFRIYTSPKYISYAYSLVSSFLGHLVCVLSRPRHTTLATNKPGDFVNPPTSYLPFRLQNFGFSIRRDSNLSDDQIQFLESLLFTSMKFNGKTIWLREEMSRDLYIKVADAKITWEDTGGVPSRYLNPHAFRAYMSTIALTTRICQTLHLFTLANEEDPEIKDSRNEIEGCKESTAYEEDNDIPAGVPATTTSIEFTKSNTGVMDAFSKAIYQVMVFAKASKLNPKMSAVVYNSLAGELPSHIPSGDTESLTAPGKIFKFEPQLATPDISIVGDIIGRYFKGALGTTHEEQFSSLASIKKGLSLLRLTEVGDELSHLYKCIGVSIEAQCGLMPFFSGSYYEGCVLAGGHGAVFSIGDHMSEFEDLVTLKDEFLTASSHGQALALISTKAGGETRGQILACKNMVALREICLTLALSSDDRDYIIQKAANLRFSQTSWVASPVNLKRAFLLISNLSQHLTPTTPISRICLFSRDPVLIGLSVFGEKNAPSLNIPNGTLCSVKSENPPSLPRVINKGTGSKGDVSDAAWVMTVRKTDLLSAVEDFKVLAATQSYRSLSSVMAKKQGFHTFSRDRMSEYWRELRAAYRQVNPGSLLDGLEATLKRSADESEMGQAAGVAQKKPRAMKF